MSTENRKAFGEKFQRQLKKNKNLARGLKHYQEKEYTAARSLLKKVAKKTPSSDVYHLLAMLEQNEGELDQAIIWLNKALKLDSKSADIYNSLGHIKMSDKQYGEAIIAFKKAVKLYPDHPDAGASIGTVLMLLNRYQEAETQFNIVLNKQPNHYRALQNLALCLKELDKQQESLAVSSRMLAIKESDLSCNNHGTILKEMGRNEEALKYFNRAIELNPKYAPAYCNAGLMMLELGDPELAIIHYKYAIALDDQDPSFYHNLAFAYFAANKYAEGWDVFRYRKLIKNVCNYTGSPEWEGEPLKGKRLLITAEQGLGDEIMFASTIADLSKEDGEIVLQCDPRLEEIYQRSFPAIKILGVDRKDINRSMEVDYENAVGDLPRFYRRSLDAFPVNDGYLNPDPRKIAHWRAELDKLGDGLKVGLCWSSGVASKIRKHLLHSTSKVSYFYPLLNISGVTIVSLQYTDITEELKIVKQDTGQDIVQLKGIDMKNDQDELAALMVALDLTVSVGTAVQQMAAAVKGSNVWAIPCNETPFHRLMKCPMLNDIESKSRDPKESLDAQVASAILILAQATKQANPRQWIRDISTQEIADRRLYPAIKEM